MIETPCHQFAADAMLGRLARWLRVLGFDTTYDEAIDDPLLVRQALDQGRILLTRDRHLLRELRPARAHEVRGDVPLEQLRQLVVELGLPPPAALFTRCILDNTALSDPLPSHEAFELLPPLSRASAGPVRRCATCGRLYWSGSHVRRMRMALERAMPGWLA
ncbi:Mut7-C RNAse domain-containing protein [Ramlibacter sp.]|uniref:Mut7-C RNAse domain-containing protein n=1 Tax=Ramlibacter sp. TaxID=1917967 RepID=UPI002C9A0B00|nr:Mut7-C RNAse domain-containing protein [Ramlibacter sp.]HWI82616.1 Mut7-C RNAse domain-containing protein [Ramlibacter sp.]